MDITLESVDKVKERTGVSYAEAKIALEATNGDVLDAIILIESQGETNSSEEVKDDKHSNNYETVDEIKQWLKELINKGNVSRIKVYKDEKTIVDVPVNAGIAAAVIAVIIPPILAFVIVAAVVTKVTIEITKTDGTTEVVNKYIGMAMNEAKEKASDIADKVKEKVSEVNMEGIKKYNSKKTETEEEKVYTYTVKFDEVE